MVDRTQDREYLKGAERPAVTEEERAYARELRAKGWLLEDIANVMGRVKSTICNILKDRR